MLAAICVAGTAAAQTSGAETARFDYRRADGAEECPTGGVIRVKVAARLGYDPFDPESDTEVRVEIAPRGSSGGYAAEIRIRRPETDTPGRRRLSTEDRTCRELVDALVFAVSVAIDPSSAMGDGEEAESTAAPTVRAATALRAKAVAVAESAQLRAARDANEEESDASATESRDREPAEESGSAANSRSDSARWEIRALAGGGLAVGAAPAPAGSFRLGVETGGSSFRAGFGGRVDLPAGMETSGGAVETSLFVGELVPCGRLAPVSVCGVVQVGGLRLRGVDLRASAARSVAHAALGPRIAAELPIGRRLSVRLLGDLLANLVRTRAEVGGETVWRTPAVAGWVGVSLGVDLGGGGP